MSFGKLSTGIFTLKKKKTDAQRSVIICQRPQCDSGTKTYQMKGFLFFHLTLQRARARNFNIERKEK